MVVRHATQPVSSLAQLRLAKGTVCRGCDSLQELKIRNSISGRVKLSDVNRECCFSIPFTELSLDRPEGCKSQKTIEGHQAVTVLFLLDAGI